MRTSTNLDRVAIGDAVTLRKQHPCGGYTWSVTRIGADIGLKCLTCGHRVMLTRRDFEKRLKTILQRAESLPTDPPSPHRGNQSGLL